MKERARELKAEEGRGRKGKADGERDVFDKIAEMPESDRVIAERSMRSSRPTRQNYPPKTWYGMPAYAKNSKIVCFLQSADKFKSRYATLGFNDEANLDKGAMWPTAFALKELTAAEKAKIGALVKKTVR